MYNAVRRLVRLQNALVRKLTQAILMQSLLASANGHHREGCLPSGTITYVDNRTVCMLSVVTDITACSPTKKFGKDINNDNLQA